MPEKNPLIRYWGRKPTKLAQKYILKHTSPEDIILDSFGGSGIFVRTALELGRKAIYVDLNPFAKLVANASIEGCDPEALSSEVDVLLLRDNLFVKVDGEKIPISARRLFEVKCKCGRAAEVKYVQYTRQYRLKKHEHDISDNLMSTIVRILKRRRSVLHENLRQHLPRVSTADITLAVKKLIKKGIIREREVPIFAEFIRPCICGRKLLNEVKWVFNSKMQPAYWYPKDRLYYEDGKRFNKQRDVDSVSQFFTDRSLATLAALWHSILNVKTDRKTKACLQLLFMATLPRSSKMARSYGGAWPMNSYWIPRRYAVKNPYWLFKLASRQLLGALRSRKMIKTGSPLRVIKNESDVSFLLADSTRIKLPRSSVDYVIIDPPHTDEAQFFELSLFYTAWLKKPLRFTRELIINNKQRKTLETYLCMLSDAAKSIRRALKLKGRLTVILHEEDKRILDKSKEVIVNTGFELLSQEKVATFVAYTFRKK